MSDANEVLKLLEARRNVLLSGAPGTGKSRLLSEVAALFENRNDGSYPEYSPSGAVPIPPSTKTPLPGNIGQAKNRKVFRCVLHQSSKYRDFLTGIMPDLRPLKNPGSFRVTEGILYRASEYAKQSGNAALLIIDEINRGPAVEVFGGSIVAIEAEKRLEDNGSPSKYTQFFDLVSPVNGELIEYAFPSQLYILAAMNQADVSVEPLDVAFLRRWAPFHLEPSAQTLRDHFGLPLETEAHLSVMRSSSREDVLEVAVRAFEAINHRIALGRGQEFRIGHGVLMAQGEMPSAIEDVLEHLVAAWRQIKNHIDESFFGDVRGTAIVLNAHRGLPENPYVLEETAFGDTSRAQIRGPRRVTSDQIYDLLKAMANMED